MLNVWFAITPLYIHSHVYSYELVAHVAQVGTTEIARAQQEIHFHFVFSRFSINDDDQQRATKPETMFMHILYENLFSYKSRIRRHSKGGNLSFSFSSSHDKNSRQTHKCVILIYI